MQFRGQGKPPLGIAFDSDMGESIDTALALAMLFGFQGKNEARVLSISISKPSLKTAGFCDAIARFYNGEPGPFLPPLAIGMAEGGPAGGETPMVTAAAARFPGKIARLNETADPLALIRNALSAQVDQNAAVVLAGPATNLAGLLKLPGARELIQQKVKLLVIAEPRLDRDAAAAKKILAEWPTPIVKAGAEVGDAIPFPGSSIEKDFAWSTAHPIVEAYRAYRAMPYDAPSTAMAAALYAVKPEYFGVEKGRLVVTDPTRVAAVYTNMVSAKPVPRVRGRRG
jgi:hypothetical protein